MIPHNLRLATLTLSIIVLAVGTWAIFVWSGKALGTYAHLLIPAACIMALIGAISGSVIGYVTNLFGEQHSVNGLVMGCVFGGVLGWFSTIIIPLIAWLTTMIALIVKVIVPWAQANSPQNR